MFKFINLFVTYVIPEGLIHNRNGTFTDNLMHICTYTIVYSELY